MLGRGRGVAMMRAREEKGDFGRVEGGFCAWCVGETAQMDQGFSPPSDAKTRPRAYAYTRQK